MSRSQLQRQGKITPQTNTSQQHKLAGMFCRSVPGHSSLTRYLGGFTCTPPTATPQALAVSTHCTCPVWFSSQPSFDKLLGFPYMSPALLHVGHQLLLHHYHPSVMYKCLEKSSFLERCWTELQRLSSLVSPGCCRASEQKPIPLQSWVLNHKLSSWKTGCTRDQYQTPTDFSGTRAQCFIHQLRGYSLDISEVENLPSFFLHKW